MAVLIFAASACPLQAETSAHDKSAITRIELHQDGAKTGELPVTLGIPFPPGLLTDAGMLRILDVAGHEVPAHVTETLRWHFRDASIRAVRVQFRSAAVGERRTLRFD